MERNGEVSLAINRRGHAYGHSIWPCLEDEHAQPLNIENRNPVYMGNLTYSSLDLFHLFTVSKLFMRCSITETITVANLLNPEKKWDLKYNNGASGT